MHQDEFLKISGATLADLLASDDLNVAREQIAFEGLLSWFNYSPETRNEDFERILEHIRLPLLSPHYLLHHVATTTVVARSSRCLELLEEAKMFHILPNRLRERRQPRTVHRHLSDMVEVIVLVGGEDKKEKLRNVNCFIPRTRTWINLTNLPFAVSSHGAVATGPSVLTIVGGEYEDGSFTPSSWRFDPLVRLWNELAPMNEPRVGLALAVLGGYVYAVDGAQGKSDLPIVSGVERYDIACNRWETVRPIKNKVACPAVVALDAHLYVFGGCIYVDNDSKGDGRQESDNFHCVDAVQCYDPRRDSWKDLAPMLTPRAGAAACTFNDKIYLFGGSCNIGQTNTVECYDPKTDGWQFRHPMNKCRARHGVAVAGCLIFVVGGDKRKATMEAYDPEADTWSDVQDMPLKRAEFGCVTLDLPAHILNPAQ